MQVLDEVEHLGLCATGAVYHAVNLLTHTIEHLLDDRGIGARGAEDKFAGIEGTALNGVGKMKPTTINEVLGHCVIVGLGILLCQILGEDIMTSRCQAIGTHTTVVFLLVGSLSETGKTNDNIAGCDVGIVDDIGALHTAGNRRIDDDGACQVTDIGRLAACSIDTDTHLTQFGHQFVVAIDDGTNDFARDEHLVATDGR